MLRSWKVMFHTIKRLVAYMPIRWQQGLKRKYYAFKFIRGDSMLTNPSISILNPLSQKEIGFSI